MSVTDTRQRLATALSTVTGVNGYVFRPSTIKAGAAWPLLDSLERGPGEYFSGNWRVIVALGGDEKQAQKQLDNLLPLIVAALEPAAYVAQAIPAVIPTSGGDLYAVELSVRSE